jgi:hypothetical protein
LQIILRLTEDTRPSAITPLPTKNQKGMCPRLASPLAIAKSIAAVARPARVSGWDGSSPGRCPCPLGKNSRVRALVDPILASGDGKTRPSDKSTCCRKKQNSLQLFLGRFELRSALADKSRLLRTRSRIAGAATRGPTGTRPPGLRLKSRSDEVKTRLPLMISLPSTRARSSKKYVFR